MSPAHFLKIQMLLKAGVDPNVGSSVLHGVLAAYSALGESAQKCARPDVALERLAPGRAAAVFSFSPFDCRVESVHSTSFFIVCCLLNDNFTPPAPPPRRGDLQTVEALLAAGANPDLGTRYGPFGASSCNAAPATTCSRRPLASVARQALSPLPECTPV